MAYRGESQMFKLIFAQCFFVREPESFDDLVARMPDIVIAGRNARSQMNDTDLTLELYVVGWSPSRERMAGAAYTINAMGMLTGTFIDSWVSASSPELPGEPNPNLDSHKAIYEHARRQALYADTVYAEYATGGKFLISEITPQEIRLTDAGYLSD